MTAPRRLPAGERRASIVSAAERLFAERGYGGTRIEDIVEAAGVTKPILYRHFASKQALHRALLEHHRDALAVAALDEYFTDGTLEQRLPAIIDAWFAYVERHPYAWRMLFLDTTGDAEVRALHRDLQARQRAADAAILRENLPGLTEAQIQPLAEVVRSSLTGLALWWRDHPDVKRQTLVDTMVDVLTGILSRHTAERRSRRA